MRIIDRSANLPVTIIANNCGWEMSAQDVLKSPLKQPIGIERMLQPYITA